MNYILEVIGLRKSYKNFSLDNVNFTLPEGCITGFIGVNGAGKTTTIKAILGLIQTTSGTIKIFGHNIKGNAQEVRNRIGVVLDEGSFYGDLTMDEMKSIVAPAYTGWKERDYLDYMERFNLNPRQKINTLSRGMKPKFALALALSHQADLLIMDEPTSGLDPLIRSELLAIMKDYMQQGGKGVLFSTHITSDLDKVADLLVLIHNGKILFQEEKDALLDNYRLVKGGNRNLNDRNKQFFLSLQQTQYGFVGVTDKAGEIKKSMPDCLLERPSIEDIMLAFVEKERR